LFCGSPGGSASKMKSGKICKKTILAASGLANV
jgi:hypothetical protein